MFKKLRLCVAAAFIAVPAVAANSVFVPGAFLGSYGIQLSDTSNRPIKNWGGDSLFLAPVSEAEGVSLINSLGDPNFNANNCPAQSEKREYYVSYQSAGVATHVACTNGTSLIMRIRVGGEQGGIRPNDNGDTGIIRFTDINAGPPATITGSGNSNNTPSFKVVLTYQSGNPGTPLARVSDDYMFLSGSTPVIGTKLVPASTQNLLLNVRYRLNTLKNATVQGTLYNGDQVLATTTPATVGSAVGENGTNFNFPSFVVPTSGTLRIRGELRSAAGTVLASSEVSWSIFEAPPLTAAPNLIRFNSPVGTNKQTDSVWVMTTSTQPVNYSASIVNASKWLSLSAPTGSISTSAILPLTMDPTGLAPGYYFDSVRVTTSLGTVNVPIALQVGPRPVSLNVEPNGLRFDVRQGQGSPISQTLNVYHSGPAGSSTNWSARVITGANLVRLSTTNGTATLGNPSTITVSLSSTATDAVGPAQALVEISSPNTPAEYVTVVANVTDTSQPAQPILTPAGLIFFAPLNSAPVSQRVQVNLSELASTNFTGSFSAGGGTFTANLLTGTVSTASPASVEITYNPTASTQGTFIVTAAPFGFRRTRLAGVTLPAAGTTCTPGGLWIRETSLMENFAIPAGLPQPLTVQLYDNCGNRIKGGSVAVSFSNGDPSLRLELDEATGDFSTTWIPQTALNSGMKLTFRPTFGSYFQRTLDINGTVTANATPPPSLVSGGIVNNLNAIVGAPLAPGTVAQVYGDNFYSGAGFELAPAPPLESRFQGARLTISGFPAPFYYISKTQAAAEIPTELTPGRTYSAILEVNGTFSVPLSLEVASLTPGVVTTGSALVAQHSDYQLVSSANPAKPNEPLVMYLVGMGATNPEVATGAPAPFSPLAQAAVQPVVTIDGQRAEILYAGLTPGYAGLYQINFKVPGTARDGDLDVVVTQNGIPANPSKLTVKK